MRKCRMCRMCGMCGMCKKQQINAGSTQIHCASLLSQLFHFTPHCQVLYAVSVTGELTNQQTLCLALYVNRAVGSCIVVSRSCSCSCTAKKKKEYRMCRICKINKYIQNLHHHRAATSQIALHNKEKSGTVIFVNREFQLHV